MEKLVLKTSIKLLCLYLVQHMLNQIKAQQFYSDLGLCQLCKFLQKIVEFKGFSRLLSDFPGLFKADLIFKDFSTKLSKFKYFSSLCEPYVYRRGACKMSQCILKTTK